MEGRAHPLDGLTCGKGRDGRDGALLGLSPFGTRVLGCSLQAPQTWGTLTLSLVSDIQENRDHKRATRTALEATGLVLKARAPQPSREVAAGGSPSLATAHFLSQCSEDVSCRPLPRRGDVTRRST